MKTTPIRLENVPESTATTPEGKETECISLAYDQARARIINGTASSAEIVHFLKLGSAKEQLEMRKTEKELELMEAKRQSLESFKHLEELYKDAITAMRECSMFGDEDEDDGW